MGLAKCQRPVEPVREINRVQTLIKESTMDGPLSFFLFFLLVLPFALMNIMAYRKERKKADEELQALLRENNELLKEFVDKTNPS
jgi:hypothetical protein